MWRHLFETTWTKKKKTWILSTEPYELEVKMGECGEEEPIQPLVFKYSIHGRLFSAGYILRPGRILWIFWYDLMDNMDHLTSFIKRMPFVCPAAVSKISLSGGQGKLSHMKNFIFLSVFLFVCLLGVGQKGSATSFLKGCPVMWGTRTAASACLEMFS